MHDVQINIITIADIANAMTYSEYRQLIDILLEQGKSTGENQSEGLTHYSKMNVQRMKRWDKTSKILPELEELVKSVDERWTWLILTEGWCGDAAQNIPTIVKIAELNPNINTLFLLRDENLHIIDEYLTNGGRSIPKLVALKTDSLDTLGSWGPRPQVLQDMIPEWKKNEAEDFKEKIHKWYAKDKTNAVQLEFIELIKSWKNNI